MSEQAGGGEAHVGTPLWQMQVEWECTRTIHGYAAAADGEDTQAFIQLFTPDGVWERPDGSVLTGHAQIRAAYEARVKKGFSRHLVTGVLVKVLDKEHAEASSVAIVLRAPWATEVPLRRAPSAHILSYQDRLKRGAAGSWQIAHRSSTVLMTLDTPAAA